jgi:hypothetical protein
MVCRFCHDERRHAGSAFNIKNHGEIMPTRLIDPAPPRASELPAPSAAPARPASEDAGQGSHAIIPGDDPGDQQPPKSTPLPSTLT